VIEAAAVSMCEIFPSLMVISQLCGSVRKTVVNKCKETEPEGLESTKPLCVSSNNTYSLKINDTAKTKT
jgi:hypothetical protein